MLHQVRRAAYWSSRHRREGKQSFNQKVSSRSSYFPVLLWMGTILWQCSFHPSRICLYSWRRRPLNTSWAQGTGCSCCQKNTWGLLVQAYAVNTCMEGILVHTIVAAQNNGAQKSDTGLHIWGKILIPRWRRVRSRNETIRYEARGEGRVWVRVVHSGVDSESTLFAWHDHLLQQGSHTFIPGDFQKCPYAHRSLTHWKPQP